MRSLLNNAWRKSRGHGKWRALILSYHRVAEARCDPWGLCVSPVRFEQQLAVLRKLRLKLVSLDDVERLHEQSEESKCAIITFDDGYVDNFTSARPILETHQVPATFFVVSGAVNRQEEFWWDHLQRLILEPSSMPPILQCIVSNSRFLCEWDDALETNEGQRRVALYRDLWTFLSKLSATARSSVLEQLAKQIGDSPPRADYLPMTRDQLRNLTGNPLFKVGAHTVTHPMLADLSAEEQREEIEESKKALEEIVEEPIDAFAFPHGSYSEQSLAICESVGLRLACTSSQGTVGVYTNVLQLPRIVVRDWDEAEFEKRLTGWMS